MLKKINHQFNLRIFVSKYMYIMYTPAFSCACSYPDFCLPCFGVHPVQVKQGHNNDIIMGAIVSQITSLTIVHSTVYSGANQRKHQKLLVTGLCAGNSPVTSEFPTQMVINTENVAIWWRHHEMWSSYTRHRYMRHKMISRLLIVTAMMKICMHVLGRYFEI